MKTILVIPCFNDNHHLRQMLGSRFIKNSNLDILVVDDGSRERIFSDDIDIKFHLIRNEINRGKGYSIRKGFKYALSKGYTHAITIDADLQHDPQCINSFIQIKSDVDIVIGARSFDGDMPFLRRVSNNITSFIVSSMTRKKVRDSQSGYRRYKLENSPFNTCYEDGFQFESEILINSLRQKDAILEHVSIPTLYNDEKSSINNTLDTYKFIKLIIRKIIAR